MLLKAGMRAKCAVCDTQVMVIRAMAAEISLTCGDVAMVSADAARVSLAHTPAPNQGTQVGKRYSNQADTLELLCVKSGSGALTADGEALVVKQAKALPSSD